MKTIQYEGVTYEVADDVADELEKLEKEEQRERWREKKRGNYSLDYMEQELHIQFADFRNSPEAILFSDKESSSSINTQELAMTISQLTESQRALLERLYAGESQYHIAKSVGVSKQAIFNRLEKIKRKFRKFLR